MRRTTGLLMAGALVVGTGGLGYAVEHAGAPRPTVAATPASSSVAPPRSVAAPSAQPAPTLTPKPTPTPRPKPKPAPVLKAGPTILGSGASGDSVRDLQARLKQIGWFSSSVSGVYGTLTASSVSGFQAKRGIPVTGAVDQRTLDRLRAMTRQPSYNELHNISTGDTITTARLDSRCLSGHVMCIDKTTRTLRWVVDGKVLRTFAVRFGAAWSPTRDGLFHVDSMREHWVSTLYGSSMPYSMFFSGGQAVHYSSDFAARGYAGASHGCVNVRDYSGIQWLFSQVHVGDPVVVYWS